MKYHFGGFGRRTLSQPLGSLGSRQPPLWTPSPRRSWQRLISWWKRSWDRRPSATRKDAAKRQKMELKMAGNSMEQHRKWEWWGKQMKTAGMSKMFIPLLRTNNLACGCPRYCIWLVNPRFCHNWQCIPWKPDNKNMVAIVCGENCQDLKLKLDHV